VTCCSDGSIAIHNPKRQHLPIKMLHLEFPPEFVHVAFSLIAKSVLSEDKDENSDPNTDTVSVSKFAVMGEYGNNVNIYDSTNFFVKHQIQAGHILRQFSFANNNREIVMVTSDCKVRVYSLAKFEGILLREISTVHRGNVTSASISNNCGYMITGGEDCMIKVWDYEAEKNVPFNF
jgi:WD40 repeat protein